MQSEDLTTYRDLTVGDRVRVPGHRRRDPASVGTLSRITLVTMPRSRGYFAEVDLGDRRVTTAIGLVSKAPTPEGGDTE